MAKGRKGRKKGSGYAVPAKGPQQDRSLAELAQDRRDQLLDDGAAWGDLQKALLKSTLPPQDIAGVVMRRDLAGLDALIARLRGEEDTDEPEPAAPMASEAIDEHTLREAMKAFRRRLKLTKLDHESRLGRSPLSTGRGADFESILPPRGFSDDVWETLAARGDLEATGRGFYGLPKPPPALRGGG